MTAAVVAGLLAGYGIAIPVGAVGAHLVAVAARSPWRTGAGAGVLLVLAAASARTALRAHRAGTPPGERPVTAPHRAFWTFLGITVLNPMTVLYFTALVLGGHATTGPAEGAVFVAAAFAASASWQLLLASTGTLLGHALTGARARLLTGLASSGLIAVLAVGLVV
ncbi:MULTISPECIES: lysine transporter LysE [Streptomyces]|uniref:Lysine transporter LysE n=2 Tax=Streptomyces TaxID=1883 RepID=A0ABU4KEE4_9ACTN|nr:lysine transporter LysE [Streptomyces roseolus]MDX2295705.1 lysine transporter LysE [Streptomyces roseolus]